MEIQPPGAESAVWRAFRDGNLIAYGFTLMVFLDRLETLPGPLAQHKIPVVIFWLGIDPGDHRRFGRGTARRPGVNHNLAQARARMRRGWAPLFGGSAAAAAAGRRRRADAGGRRT